MGRKRTQVAIVGAGPAGLLLSQLLRMENIDFVVLERRSRDYVEARIRAGVLEQGTVALLEKVGVANRMHAEGLVHQGFLLNCNGQNLRIDLHGLTGGNSVMVYGQTEMTRDLIAACLERGGDLKFEAENVALHDIGSTPSVSYTHAGTDHLLECDFIAGCDGFHGACRAAIPTENLRLFERAYPFGWLGLLADVPPVHEELIYCSHARGFALASMRSSSRSRYYVQVPLSENLDDWPDDKFWDEIALRLGPKLATHLVKGPALEKSIVPLRSFVSEPMRHGRLFLAGDAAHIVPPAGAKGLNLAAADVTLLAQALTERYRHGDDRLLDSYSERALAHIWKAERFSWWFTNLMHVFPEASPFERRMQAAELDTLFNSRAAQTVLAENYVGLPLPLD